MMVPHYNLPRMHRMLMERGTLEGANVVVGYPEILRMAGSGTRGGDGSTLDKSPNSIL